jgi:hypothetical protein
MGKESQELHRNDGQLQVLAVESSARVNQMSLK